MAALTIEVPNSLAEAVGQLEAPLVADDVALGPVIRWNIHEVERALCELADDAADIDARELRRLAQRLELLAAAAEAVA